MFLYVCCFIGPAQLPFTALDHHFDHKKGEKRSLHFLRVLTLGHFSFRFRFGSPDQFTSNLQTGSAAATSSVWEPMWAKGPVTHCERFRAQGVYGWRWKCIVYYCGDKKLSTGHKDRSSVLWSTKPKSKQFIRPAFFFSRAQWPFEPLWKTPVWFITALIASSVCLGFLWYGFIVVCTHKSVFTNQLILVKWAFVKDLTNGLKWKFVLFHEHFFHIKSS